ncbi:MAG: hypothetical protein FWB95_01645 [Treponema sp.]|nr:hypothetical protein [Treponema sp.]
MVFFGVLIGIILMGGMVFMALDKKSNFPIRLASLGAIAVMIITVIICVFAVLTHDTVIVDPSVLIVGEPAVVEEKGGSSLVPLLLTIFFFLGLFTLIVVLTMREHKRSDVKKT